jgi:hypothetical protein
VTATTDQQVVREVQVPAPGDEQRGQRGQPGHGKRRAGQLPAQVYAAFLLPVHAF